jgi:hypothetical protein
VRSNRSRLQIAAGIGSRPTSWIPLTWALTQRLKCYHGVVLFVKTRLLKMRSVWATRAAALNSLIEGDKENLLDNKDRV